MRRVLGVLRPRTAPSEEASIARAGVASATSGDARGPGAAHRTRPRHLHGRLDQLGFESHAAYRHQKGGALVGGWVALPRLRHPAEADRVHGDAALGVEVQPDEVLVVFAADG